jgi:hypothetical protein
MPNNKKPPPQRCGLQRVMARVKMGAERRRRLCQFRIVHPDLARPANLAADLFYKAIALLLRRLIQPIHVGIERGLVAADHKIGRFAMTPCWREMDSDFQFLAPVTRPGSSTCPNMTDGT